MRPPILVHAPLGDDAAAIALEIEATGEAARICPRPQDFAEAIGEGASEDVLACIVTEEGAGEGVGAALARAFAAEPAWARLPLVVLVKDVRRPPPAVRMLDRRDQGLPFLVLERPCRPAILRHAIQTQAEARRRQFETRDLLTRLRSEEERGRFLLNEVRHRTRNSLAVLQALFGLSARRADSVGELATVFGERLQNLSEAHTRLSEEGEGEWRLGDLLREHVLPYAMSEDQLRLSGPDAILSGRICFELAMVVHELATNAAKYGALSRGDGRVEVAWTPDGEGGALRLVWREHGGPPVAPPEEAGLGSRLVRRFPSTRPTAEMEFRPDGLVWTGFIPAGNFQLS